MWLVQNEVCMSSVNKVLSDSAIRFISLKNIYVQRVNFFEFELQENCWNPKERDSDAPT